MIYTILAILLVLWLLGVVTSTGGGFIHLVLLVAAMVFLFNFISGKRLSS